MDNESVQEGSASTTGFSLFGRTQIGTNLTKVGIKKVWQANAHKMLSSKIGLGGEANVPHPDYDKQWDLGYKRNLMHFMTALILWCIFILFVCYQLLLDTCDVHNLTSCITSQRTQSSAWDEAVGPSDAVVYIRSMNKNNHLSMSLTSCLITHGDYAGYLKHLRMNPPRIDPVEGGCAQPVLANMSSNASLNRLLSNGGCKLFANDNAVKDGGWCYKLTSPIVGQFGEPEFRFVKISLHATPKELLEAGTYSNIDIIFPEFVGGKTEGWNSVYYTFDPYDSIKKEMFFQRADIVKHSSLEFLSREAPKPSKTYLQYHHEYNRWERNIPVEDLLARERFSVATIYLRATSSRIVYDERQVKTLYDFPKDAGGFWTATLFVAACGFVALRRCFPRQVADFSELLKREERKHVAKQEVDKASASHKTMATGSASASSFPVRIDDDMYLVAATCSEQICEHIDAGRSIHMEL